MVKQGRRNFGQSFLAQELGDYYQRRKEYKKAIDEYILTLLSNPGKGSTISRKILMMSDDVEAKDIIEIKLLEICDKYPNVLKWYLKILKRPAVVKGYNIAGEFHKIPVP